MPLQRLEIPHPTAARKIIATGGELQVPYVASTAQLSAVTRLPKRPDPSILSEAIPLFFVGQNGDGLWVVREADGPVGGIFLCKNSALRFVKRSAEPAGYATMFLSKRFELDIENRGNPFAVQLGSAKRFVARLAWKLMAFAGKAGSA